MPFFSCSFTHGVVAVVNLWVARVTSQPTFEPSTINASIEFMGDLVPLSSDGFGEPPLGKFEHRCDQNNWDCVSECITLCLSDPRCKSMVQNYEECWLYSISIGENVLSGGGSTASANMIIEEPCGSSLWVRDTSPYALNGPNNNSVTLNRRIDDVDPEFEVYGEIEVSSGIILWRVTIDDLELNPERSEEVFIGVASPSRPPIRTALDPRYGILVPSGDVYINTGVNLNEGDYFSSGVQSGDVLYIRLDFTSNQVIFYLINEAELAEPVNEMAEPVNESSVFKTPGVAHTFSRSEETNPFSLLITAPDVLNFTITTKFTPCPLPPSPSPSAAPLPSPTAAPTFEPTQRVVIEDMDEDTETLLLGLPLTTGIIIILVLVIFLCTGFALGAICFKRTYVPHRRKRRQKLNAQTADSEEDEDDEFDISADGTRLANAQSKYAAENAAQTKARHNDISVSRSHTVKLHMFGKAAQIHAPDGAHVELRSRDSEEPSVAPKSSRGSLPDLGDDLRVSAACHRRAQSDGKDFDYLARFERDPSGPHNLDWYRRNHQRAMSQTFTFREPANSSALHRRSSFDRNNPHHSFPPEFLERIQDRVEKREMTFEASQVDDENEEELVVSYTDEKPDAEEPDATKIERTPRTAIDRIETPTQAGNISLVNPEFAYQKSDGNEDKVEVIVDKESIVRRS